MADAVIPFGEWRPDIALLDNQFVSIADNVLSTANSYKPLQSLLEFTTSTLPTLPCVGLTAARKSDGTWVIFAGSATALYKFALSGWTDVTRVAGGAYSATRWSFAQFGTNLYACNINDVLQKFDIEAGTNFVAAPGTPPQATTIRQIGDFLILCGLSANTRKIRWCSINDPTAWVVGVGLCDEQEFPEGGPVQGVSGSAIGYVVQDRSIRLMQFLPNDVTFIFQFSRVLKERGCVGAYAHSTHPRSLSTREN